MKFGSEHKQFVLYKQTERHHTTPNGIVTTSLGLPEILFEADTMPEIQSKMQDILPQENRLQESSKDPARFMYHNPRPQVAQVVLSDVAQCVFIGTNSYSIILARNTSKPSTMKQIGSIFEGVMSIFADGNNVIFHIGKNDLRPKTVSFNEPIVKADFHPTIYRHFLLIGESGNEYILDESLTILTPATIADEPKAVELHFKSGNEWQIFEALDKAGISYRGLGGYQDDSYTYVYEADLSKVYEAIAPLGFSPKE